MSMGASLEHWRSAEAALGSRILSNPVGYSLMDRSPELELLPFAEARGHLIIAFSPLAQGLLWGRYHGTGQSLHLVRAAGPLFRLENLGQTSGLIAVLREVADAHSATPAHGTHLPTGSRPALKHSVRGAWCVAKTIWHDFELRRASEVLTRDP